MDDVGRLAITIVNAQDAANDSYQAEYTEIVPEKEPCPFMGKKDVGDHWGQQEVDREFGREILFMLVVLNGF